MAAITSVDSRDVEAIASASYEITRQIMPAGGMPGWSSVEEVMRGRWRNWVVETARGGPAITIPAKAIREVLAEYRAWRTQLDPVAQVAEAETTEKEEANHVGA